MLLPGRMTKTIIKEAAKMEQIAARNKKEYLIFIATISVLLGALFLMIPASVLISIGMSKPMAAITGFLISFGTIFIVLYLSELKENDKRNWKKMKEYRADVKLWKHPLTLTSENFSYFFSRTEILNRSTFNELKEKVRKEIKNPDLAKEYKPYELIPF